MDKRCMAWVLYFISVSRLNYLQKKTEGKTYKEINMQNSSYVKKTRPFSTSKTFEKGTQFNYPIYLGNWILCFCEQQKKRNGEVWERLCFWRKLIVWFPWHIRQHITVLLLDNWGWQILNFQQPEQKLSCLLPLPSFVVYVKMLLIDWASEASEVSDSTR